MMLPLPYTEPSLLSDEVQLFKYSEKEPLARLFSAFPGNDRLTFRLSLSRKFAASAAVLELYADGEDVEPIRLAGEYDGGENPGSDVFSFSFAVDKLTGEIGSGLFYYCFSIETPLGELILSQNEEEGGFCVGRERYGTSRFQLLLYDAGFQTPEYCKGGIFYQIFVDRFYRGGKHRLRKGAKLCDDWNGGIPQFVERAGEPLRNDLFFGGDLDGVRKKLPYLASLGVNLLYLNPIFDAASNHKYDTGDYEKVDEMFGGEKALEALLREAEKQGIRVILDGVFNHTGDDSRYFNKYGHYPELGAYQSPDSPYADWYSFTDYPDSYACWWGIPILPRVDSANPGFQAYLCGEKGVIATYMKKGVGGWRLDVADELDESLLFRLRCAIKQANPEALLIGEVWEDASNKISYGKRRSYFRGRMLDSVMNYPLKNAVIDYVMQKDATLLSFTMRVLYGHYPKCCSDTLMNFLGTHDTERILTVLAGAPLAGASGSVLAEKGYMSRAEKEKLLPRLSFAWLLLLSLPGIPCIYYGDEAGMDGYHDPFNRRAFPWGEELQDFTDFFRRAGKIRRGESLFADGYYREISHRGGVFLAERFSSGDDSLLIAANAGETPATIYFDGLRTDLVGGMKYREAATLPPLTVMLLKNATDPHPAADMPELPR